jgi:putative phosphoribosyl transferase
VAIEIASRLNAELELISEKAHARKPQIQDRVVILVDDWIETGATLHEALRLVRSHGPSRVIVAVAVAPLRALRTFTGEVADFIWLGFAQRGHPSRDRFEHARLIGDRELGGMLERPGDRRSAALLV